MKLWIHWCNAIVLLHPAFSRTRTFMWFITLVAGLSVRADHLGVTSIKRALSLGAKYYDNLLDNCHSVGISLPKLSILWIRAVFHLFGERIKRVNGRSVVVGDGEKKGKEGKEMPAVKSLHQESGSNTKHPLSWAIAIRHFPCL